MPGLARLAPGFHALRHARTVRTPRRGRQRRRRRRRRKNRDQDLGPQNLGERAEGDVGDRRDRAAARAHRYRRAVRPESGAGLSGDEPQRAGADAGRRGRLPAVGVERDRAPSRRQAPRRRARAGRPARARPGQPMDGLAAFRRRAGDHADAFIGLIRTPPEKRDHAAIEESKTKTTDGDDHPRRAAGEDRAMSPAMDSRTATSPSPSWSTVIASWCPSGRRCPRFERWYAEVSARQAFKDHVGAVPLT